MPMHNLWNHSRADGVASTKPVPKLSQQPPHKQEPVGPAPHSTTTSPSLLTSNGATRHTASPVSHQLPHNQASPHNNASPLNYMYQWTHTFPAPNTTHGTSGPISPHCNWTYISTGASSCPLQSTIQSPPPPPPPPKLHMDLAPRHFHHLPVELLAPILCVNYQSLLEPLYTCFLCTQFYLR